MHVESKLGIHKTYLDGIFITLGIHRMLLHDIGQGHIYQIHRIT